MNPKERMCGRASAVDVKNVVRHTNCTSVNSMCSGVRKVGKRTFVFLLKNPIFLLVSHDLSFGLFAYLLKFSSDMQEGFLMSP